MQIIEYCTLDYQQMWPLTQPIRKALGLGLGLYTEEAQNNLAWYGLIYVNDAESINARFKPSLRNISWWKLNGH